MRLSNRDLDPSLCSGNAAVLPSTPLARWPAVPLSICPCLVVLVLITLLLLALPRPTKHVDCLSCSPWLFRLSLQSHRTRPMLLYALPRPPGTALPSSKLTMPSVLPFTSSGPPPSPAPPPLNALHPARRAQAPLRPARRRRPVPTHHGVLVSRSLPPRLWERAQGVGRRRGRCGEIRGLVQPLRTG